MPGDEHKIMNRAENRARSAIISSIHQVYTDNCISRTTSRKEVNKMAKCFSCPGDCKELSKKTKRSTYDSNQARTKPWPTRPRTADLRQLLADHEADKDKRDTKCFSNLGDCRGLSKEARRWNSRNQGSSQLTVWQCSGLHARIECKLTSRPRIQKQTKQEDTKILATIQNFRRRQERYRPKQTQPTLQGPSSTTMWVWLSL